MTEGRKLVLLMIATVFLIGLIFWLIGPIREEGRNALGGLLSGSLRGTIQRQGPQQVISLDKSYKAILKTDQGDITIELYTKNAPSTVNNFVYLSKTGFYDGSYFHRVVEKFVIQAGKNKNGQEPSYVIPDEINADSLGLDDIKVKDAIWLKDVYNPEDKSTQAFSPENLEKYKDYTIKQFYKEVFKYTYRTDVVSRKAEKWSVGMANNGPNSARSQFFIITYSSQPHLDGRYTIFGKVAEGFDVVKRIESLGENKAKILDVEIVES
uniref:Peptidyl-prolyl cis-trans isomerase n=1 Tax=candidate division CPR3 bacterium TaxID=2268181 RepID=A0A7C5YXJ8_UNCC3